MNRKVTFIASGELRGLENLELLTVFVTILNQGTWLVFSNLLVLRLMLMNLMSSISLVRFQNLIKSLGKSRRENRAISLAIPTVRKAGTPIHVDRARHRRPTGVLAIQIQSVRLEEDAIEIDLEVIKIDEISSY